MNRRTFIRCSGAATAGPAACLRSALGRDAPRRPNLVLVLIDDMGWRDAGFAGGRFVDTPNLDRLARRGVTFTQAYAAAPNCAPTRACLMTGQYTPRHGVYTVVDENHAPGKPHHRVLAAESKAQLDTNADTIADMLSRNGYATGMVGMWNLGRGRRGPCTPTGQGFDTYTQPKDLGFERDAYHNADGEYLTDRLTDAAIDVVRACGDRPFFLYLAYHAIHSPFDPDPELLAKYRRKGNASEEQAAYAATIEAVDQNIGRLWAELESLELADDTCLFFTSDNGGTHRRTAPLREGKGTLYEGGIRVPAFVTGPGIEPNRKSDVPISSIDFLPTLAELAGAPVPVVDGTSLVPLLRDGKELSRNALYWHFPCYIGRGKPASAVRAGDWKLIEFFETQSVELYNLADDPGETRDLSRSQPERARKLHAQLRDWQKETGAPRPTAPNPDYDPTARPARGRHGGERRGRNRRKNQ